MIKQNLDLIFLSLIMLALIMFEETVDIVHESAEVLFEVLHNLFEIVELGVEGIVEHAFHTFHVGEFFAYLFITERHAGQVFTFYILMSIIGYALFRLSSLVPRAYEFCKQQILYSWIRRKTQCQLFWQSLNDVSKIMLVVSAVGAVILSAFFLI